MKIIKECLLYIFAGITLVAAFIMFVYIGVHILQFVLKGLAV